VRQLIIAVVIALASTSCTGSGGGGDEANTELQSRNEQLKQQLELAEQRADEAEAALAVDEEEGDERQTDDPDSDATIEGDESSEAGASVGEVEHGAWPLIVEPSPECMNGVAFIYDGLEDEEHSAQGQFCLVRVEVEHLGDSPEFLWPTEWQLEDSAGRTHSHNSEVSGTWSWNEDGAYAEELNPGQTGTVAVFYDIPRDVTPSALHIRFESESPTVIELGEPEWTGQGDVEWQTG
jgi:hypothetical protein